MNNIKNQDGISLIEILIAIALLVVVGAAMIQLGVVALSTSDASRSRSIGLQLADEAIEVARSVRDEDPTTFFALTTAAQGKKYYFLDQGSTTFVEVSSTNCNPTSSPPLVHSSCTLSNVSVGSGTSDYYRIITLDPKTDDRFEVTSYVLWNNSGDFSNVATGTILTRWK
ncbi:hypothetical protein GW793_03205 [bacterium]|uniref:Type IV pilus modification protein PilV n=2 Tax=Katanobacteria TaxID=422282 RepID=A0A2M7X099_UNCKA|nr:hypothetical protein [bacterium]PIP56289.1 MAG: hypothetical protein COX05_03720 [candidate division WWE3 bacterium CG22_combo_CG10-13_8_21_14_all_39_12]PJA39496.1 MAG: hypothetical protein CO179_05045 [candidate division WWE3 bacterium CG_4_9_14_3_um_filter_39_7]